MMKEFALFGTVLFIIMTIPISIKAQEFTGQELEIMQNKLQNLHELFLNMEKRDSIKDREIEILHSIIENHKDRVLVKDSLITIYKDKGFLDHLTSVENFIYTISIILLILILQ